MLLRIVYPAFRATLRSLVRGRRGEGERGAELLILRHEVAAQPSVETDSADSSTSTTEPDLLAFLDFPAERRSKLRSTNPLERVNREIARRSDVVGIYPNDASLIRLASSLLVAQNDEWPVSKRYLSYESIAALYTPGTRSEIIKINEQEVAALTPILESWLWRTRGGSWSGCADGPPVRLPCLLRCAPDSRSPSRRCRARG
jgi:hypothetical protein